MSRTGNVTLDLGDGSLITNDFIKNEILKRFHNPILSKLEDGARIELSGRKIVLATDSFIVDPPFFPGGNIGKLAVTGTVNDLVASGAIPSILTFSLILSEGLNLTLVDQILDSFQAICRECNIHVVAGDTKVLPWNVNNYIVINTTGIGYPVRSDCEYNVSNAKPGDNVIITGEVGNHGLAVFSAREGLGFCQKVHSDCTQLIDLICPLLRKYDEIHCLRDPTRGGLVGVLCDIVESSNVNIVFRKEKVPLQREVQYGCEMLGIDPFCLPNEGKMVIVVSAAQTEVLLADLKGHQIGADSSVIGYVEEPHADESGHLIILKNGSREIIDRTQVKVIPRLC